MGSPHSDSAHVYETGTNTDVVPAVAPASVGVEINSPSSTTANLIIDSTNGDPIPAGGLNYSGGGGLIKTGSGSVVLFGANTYTGGTTVSAGTLLINAASALPGGTSLMVDAGGTFVFDPSESASIVSAEGLAARDPDATVASEIPTPLNAAIALANAPALPFDKCGAYLLTRELYLDYLAESLPQWKDFLSLQSVGVKAYFLGERICIGTGVRPRSKPVRLGAAESMRIGASPIESGCEALNGSKAIISSPPSVGPAPATAQAGRAPRTGPPTRCQVPRTTSLSVSRATRRFSLRREFNPSFGFRVHVGVASAQAGPSGIQSPSEGGTRLWQ